MKEGGREGRRNGERGREREWIGKEGKDDNRKVAHDGIHGVWPSLTCSL